MPARLERWARGLRRDLHALHHAARDPRVPWRAKLVAVGVVGYALSPIDLIPDFIPVLGWLDDLVIVPLGLLLAVKMIPAEIMAEHRAVAEAAGAPPASKMGAAAIIAVWIALAIILGSIVFRYFRS